MTLSRLEISHFRNLDHVPLEPSASYNLFYGENGSGKTSVLEAIYHLGLGRSFRTRVYDRIIQQGFESFSIFGVISSVPAGIERNNQGESRIKIGNDEVGSIAELANILPLQLINSESFQLITMGPKIRREFIDWGMFHVEHLTFMPLWKRAQRVLKQRNAFLREAKLAIGRRCSIDNRQLNVWNEELIDVTRLIDEARSQYISLFSPVFLQILSKLLTINDLSIYYFAGWDINRPFKDIINDSFERDMQLGYTQYGPHRADLVLRVNNSPIQDVLSRGQQKLVVCALRLSQAILLNNMKQKKAVFLVDDFPSELDAEKRILLSQILKDLQAQVFITGIERESLSELFAGSEAKIFRVSEGQVTQD